MKFSAMSRMISEKFQVVSTRIFDDMQIFSTSQLKEDFCTENSVLYFTDSFYRVNTETLQGSFLWYGDGPETLSSFSANWIQVRELKRSASSLSRELSRNKISHRPYSPSRAQRRYQRCKKNCGRKPILADQGNLQLIRRLLREEWSPEEIQYRLKHEKNSLQISYTTIYRALSSGQIDEYSPSYIRKCDCYALRGIPFYFAAPYSPWQRETNENTNGLLRQYFPKETSFDDVSDSQLADVVAKINLHPRKCLNWLSPFEVFFDTLLHLT